MGYVALQESLFVRYARIVYVIVCYWVVSISLVFVNKYLLSGQDVKLDAPLFVTCFQCIVTVVLCVVLRYLTNMFPAVFSFPSVQLKRETIRKVLPLSVIFVAMITFNNLCLKHVGVPFYYIGRSLSTVFNVVLTMAYLKQKVSPMAVLCCLVIVSGFILGVNEEEVSGSLSVRGIIYGVLASFFVSLNSIFIKKVLSVVDENIWQLTFYNNVNAIILFMPLILVFGEVKEVLQYEQLSSAYFWFLLLLSGVFAFAIGYVTGLQIKVTSALTHNISGTAKACAQTVLAVVWFQESKSFLWWLSNSIVLVGSAAYTRVQQLEMIKDYQEKLGQLQNELESQDKSKM